LELVEVLSEGGYRLVRQGHQPVDQAQEFPDFVVGVAGVEQADRQFQTQVVEAIGLPTVAPSSTVQAKSKAVAAAPKGRLSIGKVRALPGKPVSVPVTVDGVDTLGSLQMTLSWDPTTASFAGVTGVGLSGLSADHLGLSRVAEGLVSLSWDSPTGRPVALAGGGELLRLDLVPKSGLALSGAIDVAEQPTRLELTDGRAEVAATVAPGWWVIGSEPDDGARSETVSLRIVSTNGGPIRLEAIGPARVPLVVEASEDLATWAESQRLTGQGPGQPVTVTPTVDPEKHAWFWRVRVR
jgi:hypothetical protein